MLLSLMMKAITNPRLACFVCLTPFVSSAGEVYFAKPFILRAARNETGERSGVSSPVPRSCTGKLTHAARQFSHS